MITEVFIILYLIYLAVLVRNLLSVKYGIYGSYSVRICGGVIISLFKYVIDIPNGESRCKCIK